jgi:hypothetical protein
LRFFPRGVPIGRPASSRVVVPRRRRARAIVRSFARRVAPPPSRRVAPRRRRRASRREITPRATPLDDPRALRDATDRSVAMGSASRAPIATTESRRDDAPIATRVRSMDRWIDGWMNGWIAKCARNALESAR